MAYPFILTPGSSLSIFINNKNYIVDKSHPNFLTVINAIKAEEWDSILNLIDLPKMINTVGKGKVTVVDGEVLYDNTVVHNSLTTRILGLLTEGFDITPFVNFMENLMSNPSKQAVEELYDFLEKCSLPITEDGHFLAYKKVRSNWKDFHTNTFDHSIGTTLEMPRNMVDDRRHNTCSTGFHFCSFSYLSQYASNSDYRVVVVKINPRDVVSIPSDYNYAKGRACKYTVVSESDGGVTTETLDKSCYSFPDAVDINQIDQEAPSDVVKKTAKRGPNGRFLPKSQW